MIKLGQKVQDRITGFAGVATAKVDYLTGCTQIGVTPPVDKDGKVQETHYFDHTRLDVTDITVIAPTSQDTGGPNRDQPSH